MEDTPDAPPFVVQLRADLEAMCEDLLIDGPSPQPRLWRRLERDVARRVHEEVTRGQLVGYRVSCAPLRLGSAHGAVLEVALRLPRRVTELLLRLAVR